MLRSGSLRRFATACVMAGSLTVLHNTPSEAVAEKAVTEKAILPETGVAATEATAKTDEALAKEVTEEVT